MNLKISWLLLLSTQFCINLVHSKTLNCRFHFGRILGIEQKYRCEVLNSLYIFSSKIRTVTSTIGTHLPGNSNNIPIILFFNEKNITYFPRAMEKLFPKIIGIELTRGPLKEICEDDLKELNELESLNLAHNDIEVLEDDLFKHNKFLRTISFHENKIFHIGQSTFEIIIRTLNDLYFTNNPCISINVNRVQLEKSIKDFQKKCNNIEFVTINSKLDALNALINNISIENYSQFKEIRDETEIYFVKSSLSHSFVLRQRIDELSDLKELTMRIIINEQQIMNKNVSILMTNLHESYACENTTLIDMKMENNMILSRDNSTNLNTIKGVPENLIRMYVALCVVFIIQSISMIWLCIACMCRKKTQNSPAVNVNMRNDAVTYYRN